MIDNVLKVIANEVNKYIVRKLDPDRDPGSVKRIVTGNISKIAEPDASGRADSAANSGILSLVNLEEEKSSKTNNFVRINDKIEYRNPKIQLNLYCLFALNHSNYDTSLQHLSLIIQFFQSRNVIDHRNTPPDNGLALDPRVEKLIFDMISMNAEQVNHLWATLGGKYLPSVLFKVRMITIEDETPVAQTGAVSKLSISGNDINN